MLVHHGGKGMTSARETMLLPLKSNLFHILSNSSDELSQVEKNHVVAGCSRQQAAIFCIQGSWIAWPDRWTWSCPDTRNVKWPFLATIEGSGKRKAAKPQKPWFPFPTCQSPPRSSFGQTDHEWPWGVNTQQAQHAEKNSRMPFQGWNPVFNTLFVFWNASLDFLNGFHPLPHPKRGLITVFLPKGVTRLVLGDLSVLGHQERNHLATKKTWSLHISSMKKMSRLWFLMKNALDTISLLPSTGKPLICSLLCESNDRPARRCRHQRLGCDPAALALSLRDPRKVFGKSWKVSFFLRSAKGLMQKQSKNTPVLGHPPQALLPVDSRGAFAHRHRTQWKGPCHHGPNQLTSHRIVGFSPVLFLKNISDPVKCVLTFTRKASVVNYCLKWFLWLYFTWIFGALVPTSLASWETAIYSHPICAPELLLRLIRRKLDSKPQVDPTRDSAKLKGDGKGLITCRKWSKSQIKPMFSEHSCLEKQLWSPVFRAF